MSRSRALPQRGRTEGEPRFSYISLFCDEVGYTEKWVPLRLAPLGARPAAQRTKAKRRNTSSANIPDGLQFRLSGHLAAHGPKVPRWGTRGALRGTRGRAQVGKAACRFADNYFRILGGSRKNIEKNKMPKVETNKNV